MGGLQLVQLESYWGEILILSVLPAEQMYPGPCPGLGRGVKLVDSSSANKILINKTGVSGDLRVLLRVREERCSSE